MNISLGISVTGMSAAGLLQLHINMVNSKNYCQVQSCPGADSSSKTCLPSSAAVVTELL